MRGQRKFEFFDTSEHHRKFPMPPANRPLPFRMDPCVFRDFGLALRTTIVTQASERLGVALSVDDRKPEYPVISMAARCNCTFI